MAAVVVGAVALPAAAVQQPAHPARASVYISKVQYDSPGRDNRSPRSLNAEWVDVTNSTRKTVNLDRWTLKDDAGHTYTFRHVRLAGRATVRVHTGIGRDTRTDLYQDRRTYVWNNNGDTATLRTDRGRVDDRVSWGRDRSHRH
ncbi:hypothetical protein AQI95_42710 [Streptomyces yokosukanensis]|uniref:LTD domain-containing protein n=1 Tax=Streptomyces yokosukanensis TaxID=67386 RepID=A0A101NMW5_9ACTN|nr:hypothetical protein AQI95_42710 [Streptomyces yokosukanensis]